MQAEANSKFSDFEWSYQVEDVSGRATFWSLVLAPCWLLIASWFWVSETVEKVVLAGIVVFAISSFSWSLLVRGLKGQYSIRIVEGNVIVVSPHSMFGNHFRVRCRDLDSLNIQYFSGEMTDSVEISLREKNGFRHELTVNSSVPLPEIYRQIRLRNPQFECHFYRESRESDQHFKIQDPKLYEMVSSMNSHASLNTG